MLISKSQNTPVFVTLVLAALMAVAMSVYAVAHSASSDVELGYSTAAAVHALANQEQSLTLEQAVAMVEAKYKARALRYNTVEEDGRSVHYIRLITPDHSRVFTVRVDATTGQELPQ